MGQYNVVSGTTGSWVATDPLFIIGNGTGTGANSSNAMTVLKNGNVGIGTAEPGATLEVAGQVKITGGTPGANKVLTSNVDGLATWQTPSSGGITQEVDTLDTVLARGFTTTRSATFDSDGNETVTIGGNLTVSGAGNSSFAGKVGIGTTNPLAKLSVYDGAILATGASAGTPVSGAGIRMMWIPARGAFRAGNVDGSQWDDANIGNLSTAMGNTAKASGIASTAMGFYTIASGQNSFAIGNYTAASEESSTAMGRETTASGQYSTAMGRQTKASGTDSTAMGYSAQASGGQSAAIGYSTIASGTSSIAMGKETTASGGYSTAMGVNTIASGDASTAMGETTTAKPYASLAIGRYNIVSGTPGSWVATDPLFIIGNGANAGSPSNAMTVLKNGNVGIGTVSPGAMLEVAGQVKITGGAPGSGKVLTSDTNGLATWQTAAGGGITQEADTLNSVLARNGISTRDATVGKLTVSGDAYGIIINNPNPVQYNSTSVDIKSQGTSKLKLTYAGNADPLNSGLVIADPIRFTIYQGGTARFSILPDSGNISMATGSEKVGIGTATPGEKLTVVGTIETNGLKMTTGASNGYVLTSDTNGIGTWKAAAAGGITQEADTLDSVLARYGISTRDATVGKLTVSGTATSEFAGPVILAKTSGNVGIGTTEAQATLDVNGTAKISRVLTEAKTSLTTADFGKTITAASAQTITLPDIGAGDIGAIFTIVKLGAGTVTIDAVGSDVIADSPAGGRIYNSAAGETYANITIQVAAADKWVVVGGHGTWTTSAD
jgi:hypothetical protein